MASQFVMSVASLVICCLSIPGASAAAATAPPLLSPPPPAPVEETEALTIGRAVDEMQRAGYYSFAMLVGMVQDGVRGHVTFLAPTDAALSEAPPPEARVLEFVQVHSIPAPLLYEDLGRLPDGTAIPTNRTGYAVEISGGGGGGNRVGLFLNGTEVVRADVCVGGSSVRCHGIGGVLNAAAANSSGWWPPSASCQRAPKPRCQDSRVVSNGRSGRSGGGGGALLVYEDLLAVLILLMTLLF